MLVCWWSEETDLTEISKFEWKEKTCEDIIEDMKKNAYLIFPSIKTESPR